MILFFNLSTHLIYKLDEELISIILFLPVSPLTIFILDLAVLKCLARNLISSILAFPFSGTALSFILRKLLDSSIISVREDLGMTLTVYFIFLTISFLAVRF